MNTKIKIERSQRTIGAALLTFFSLSCICLAKESGDGIGNGGDIIRAAFIATGQKILLSLKKEKKGREITSQHQIKLNEIEQSLNINFIRVENGTLRDNLGSVVDARGTPEGIILNASTWRHYVLGSENLQELVFHELLRAQSINDDNYRISAKLPALAELPQPIILDGGYAILRDEFSLLSTPNQQSLAKLLPANEEKVFGCREFCIDHGVDGGSLVTATQFRERGIQLNSEILRPSKQVYGVDDLGITGVIYPGFEPKYGSIRINNDGGFIIEVLSTGSNNYNHYPSAITVPALRSYSYIACDPVKK